MHSLIGRFRQYNFERDGILVCKRKDDNDILISSDELKEKLDDLQMKFDLIVTDFDVFPADVKMYTEWFLSIIRSEISKYKFVITDRLHGTIFSLIANTPVLLIGLRSDKVQANYEWYKEVPDILQYIDKINDISELYEKIDEMLKKKYDYRVPDYFYRKYFDGFILK